MFRDIFERELKDTGIDIDQVDQELERIERAFESVLQDLGQSTDRVHQALNSDMAEIFRAQEEMLRDATLINTLRTEIEEELVSAQKSVQRVFRRLEEKFRSMESEVLQQREDDMVDLGRTHDSLWAGDRSFEIMRLNLRTKLMDTIVLGCNVTIEVENPCKPGGEWYCSRVPQSVWTQEEIEIG